MFLLITERVKQLLGLLFAHLAFLVFGLTIVTGFLFLRRLLARLGLLLLLLVLLLLLLQLLLLLLFARFVFLLILFLLLTNLLLLLVLFLLLILLLLLLLLLLKFLQAQCYQLFVERRILILGVERKRAVVTGDRLFEQFFRAFGVGHFRRVSLAVACVAEIVECALLQRGVFRDQRLLIGLRRRVKLTLAINRVALVVKLRRRVGDVGGGK